jgi:ubiquinone/menaquinone biosynthesis C-methylase UbiE
MKSLFDVLFVRDKHVCPWYCCFTFDNIFRKGFQNPYKILSGYLKVGDTVLDVGPGQGYFSIPLAKMVGENGRVIAIDIQKKMLDILERRAQKENVADRILFKLVSDVNYGINSEVDFALAFWMVHEVPDKKALLQSIYDSMKHGKQFLVAEPYLHVTNRMMEETVKTAQGVGFTLINRPKIFFCRSALMRKD